MANRFEDKAVVVTGAGKGIGRATAQAFAAEEAEVAVLDYDVRAGEETVDAIRAAGGKALFVFVDVASAAKVASAVASVVESFGGIDVLVNNAGVQRNGEVPDFSEEDWDFVVGTNLKGCFLMSKHAIPHIRERGGGAIVNISSVQAFASQPSVAAYAASKGGVVSMTRTMALDHAKDGIRVNCVCPGSVETPLLRHGAELMNPEDPEGTMEQWGALHPIKRLIQPEDVAPIILFLASEEAAVITGAAYLADGGLVAKLGV